MECFVSYLASCEVLTNEEIQASRRKLQFQIQRVGHHVCNWLLQAIYKDSASPVLTLYLFNWNTSSEPNGLFRNGCFQGMFEEKLYCTFEVVLPFTINCIDLVIGLTEEGPMTNLHSIYSLSIQSPRENKSSG